MNRRKQDFLNKTLIFVVAVLILVAGFGLGLLFENSQNNNNFGAIESGQIIFQEADMAQIEEILKVQNQQVQQNSSSMEDSGAANITIESSGSYVASSRGSKYYPESCSAAKSLSLNNLIYFNSQQEAEAAGYSQSASCDF